MLVLLLVVLIPLEFIWCHMDHLSGMVQIWSILPGMAVLVACLLYCMWRPLPKLVEPTELVIIAVWLTYVLSVLIQVAGRTHHPFIDHDLARMDGHLHLTTLMVVRWIATLPVLRDILSAAYNLIGPLLVVAVILPAIFNKKRASQQLILGVVIAALITAFMSWLWPAVGPWSVEGFAPSRIQAVIAQYLMQLRSGAPMRLNMTRAGIVTFPSFHVVLSMLCAVALSSLRRLRIPVWCLAILICMSTMALGWHYASDVLAGLAVAAISYAMAWPLVHSESWTKLRFQKF